MRNGLLGMVFKCGECEELRDGSEQRKKGHGRPSSWLTGFA